MNRIFPRALACAIALGLAPLAMIPTTAAPAEPDTESGRFAACDDGPRVTCVVDGDTFWYRGTKIRIADINAPEVSHPSCPYEARLGAAATRRLTDLLNAGRFALMTEGRETDRYGRALRIVVRRGQSLGAVLESEGLAEHRKGRRGNWCV
jgi:micrococcal nuclease